VVVTDGDFGVEFAAFVKTGPAATLLEGAIVVAGVVTFTIFCPELTLALGGKAADAEFFFVLAFLDELFLLSVPELGLRFRRVFVFDGVF